MHWTVAGVLSAVVLAGCGDQPTSPGSGSGGSAGVAGTSGSGGAGAPATGGNANVGGAGGAMQTTGDAGPTDAGNEGSASTGQAFFPDHAVKYVGEGPSGGLEIIASTLSPKGNIGVPVWWAAVANKGTSTICSITIPAKLMDAGGAAVAMTEAVVRSPVYEGASSLINCIGPGEFGVGQATSNLANVDLGTVKRIEHGFSGSIAASPVKSTLVTTQQVMIAPGPFGGKVLKGKAVAGSTGVRNLGIDVFVKDSAGRPLAALGAAQLTPLGAGQTFDFTTSSFDGEFTDYYLFVDYSSP